MRGLILAAGKGTRLRPLTDDRPKPMVEVAGVPLICHLFEWLKSNDVRELAINLHHKPEVLRRYVGDGSRFGIKVKYSYEPKLLGSAGALVPLREFFIREKAFVVLYGDVLTNLSLEPVLALHRSRNCDATIVVARTEEPTRCGIVDFDGAGLITKIQEKPTPDEVFSNWANTGIYVCSPTVFEALPHPCDVPYDFGHHLFPRMLGLGLTLVAFPTDALTIDIGSSERLRYASETLLAEPPLRHRGCEGQD